jgi:futalosine hydrolase
MREILIVAATERELCGRNGLVCGVGPVDAAAATARALVERRPDAVLHVGVAGATGIAPGALVVGSEAVYVDLRAEIPVVATSLPDPALLADVLSALPDAPLVPIRTSAAVSGPSARGRGGTSVEAMEGFGVLRACELAGVPAVEVRAISNALGEPDRARWDVDGALTALTGALPRVLAALAR